jgi:hypothetical protein
MPTGIPKNGYNKGWIKKGEHPSLKTEFKKGNPGYWLGKKRPNLKLPQAFKNGVSHPTPWLIGKKQSKETIEKRKMMDNKNPAWKGENVGYGSLHRWVETHLGKPQICEFCGKENNIKRGIDWANKSGLYKRELSDWLRLCKSCHKIYDLKRQSLGS